MLPKSNQLHDDIFGFVFINFRYSLDSFKMIGNFPNVLNLNQFICDIFGFVFINFRYSIESLKNDWQLS